LSTNHTFPDAVALLYKDKVLAHKLLSAITELSIEYATTQAKHGISVFQIFETHAGLIPSELYFEMIMPYVRKISAAVMQAGTPVIFLPKGLGYGVKYIEPEDANFLSIDWQMSIEEARYLVHPEIGLQGNLDPRLLLADQKTIQEQLEKYIDFGSQNQNWIFNLGHGFIPGIPFENAKFVVDWVKSADWKRN
jgi:uroporphyrinogen decarboxylase